LIKPAEPRAKESNQTDKHSTLETNSQARKTTLVVAAVLFAIALWNLYRGRTNVTAVLSTTAVVLTLIGLLVPFAARGFHRFWMSIALVLGYINSRIILSLLYYGVFTPVGIVRRLMGRDPLHRRGANQSSYWVKRENTRQAKEQFERLF
jgi:hypothetical protein